MKRLFIVLLFLLSFILNAQDEKRIEFIGGAGSSDISIPSSSIITLNAKKIWLISVYENENDKIFTGGDSVIIYRKGCFVFFIKK